MNIKNNIEIIERQNIDKCKDMSCYNDARHKRVKYRRQNILYLSVFQKWLKDIFCSYT